MGCEANSSCAKNKTCDGSGKKARGCDMNKTMK
jgi:hypothetical protein